MTKRTTLKAADRGHNVRIRVSQTLRSKIEAAADLREQTLSDYCRTAIIEAIKVEEARLESEGYSASRVSPLLRED